VATLIDSFWPIQPPQWPESIRATFGDYITDGGCIYFVNTEPKRNIFLKMCHELDVRLRTPQTHLLVEPRELKNYSFYYLNTQIDEANRAYDSFDYAGRCPGGPRIRRCFTGATQVRPIKIVDHPTTDIVKLYSDSPVNVFVVSRRLMIGIKALNATGV
jgi:hypothetical protein